MDETREAFESAGLRFTRQRGAVYSALASVKTHPTADELFELVRESDPNISLATVYNSLEALSDAGLCRRMPGGDGAFRFDANMDEHVHAVLPDGRVIDLDPGAGRSLLGALPASLVADLERRAGVPLDGLTVQVIARPRPAADR